MNEKTFRIVITGVSSGNSPQKVIGNLSRLFKTDPSKFQSLASGKSIAVINNADQNKANAYSAALTKVGCKVLVEPSLKQPGISLERDRVSTPTHNIKCPKCNYVRKPTDVQPESECPKCGIIYTRSTKTQNQCGINNDKSALNSKDENLTGSYSNPVQSNKIYAFIISGILCLGVGIRSCSQSGGPSGLAAQGFMALVLGIGLIIIGIQYWRNPKGVEKSKNDLNFITACDIPEIHMEFVEKMLLEIEGYDIIMPVTGVDRYEPLFAVYRKSVIGPAEEILNCGKSRIIELFKYLNVKFIELPENNWYLNINTIENYHTKKK